jgi:tetratricopeptide (TPR) repeat protein
MASDQPLPTSSASPQGPPAPTSDALLDKALDALTFANSHGSNPAVSLPPAMAAMHGKSSTEILAELNKTPLFMTDLEENDELEAFKALVYEGTPSEVAGNFKEQGNECFKSRGWRDAKEFYGKGVQVLEQERRKREHVKSGKAVPTSVTAAAAAAAPATTATADGPSPPQQQKELTPEEHEEEIKKQLELLPTLLLNRAACHLNLQNYRSCIQDCAASLRLNSSQPKAYFRSAKALLALSKIPEADDACARGLALAPDDKALLVLAEEIIKKNSEIEAKRRKEEEARRRKLQEETLLRAALKARGVRTRRTPQPPEMEDAKVRLVPDPLDPRSEIVYPVVLLYPLVLQSDFIKEFGETELLGERLDQVLEERPAWDREGEYGSGEAECYMETLTGGLVRVGRKVSLLAVLGKGNVEVVDEVVRIFVVPKQKADGWIADFKRKKAAEKGVR